MVAGEPAFPQLDDICHEYDSIMPPALGGPAPMQDKNASRAVMWSMSSAQRCQLGCSSQSIVVSKRLSAGTISMGWEAALVPAAMAQFGGGSWRGMQVCRKGAWGRAEVGRWPRREGSTHKAVRERKDAFGDQQEGTRSSLQPRQALSHWVEHTQEGMALFLVVVGPV